jgi:hypothetical protein
MNDLALDVITNDLQITGLDLSIIEAADRVRQQLLIKLNLWVGEWFLDTEFGTPYLDNILGKQISLAGSVAAMKKAILEVNDVQSLTFFNYSFDRAARKLTVDFECNTPFGIVRITT